MNFEAIKEAIRAENQWEALYNAELNHNFGEKGVANNGFAKPPCRCPLHSEKKASFSVNLSTGIFSCQGCKETGDFFRFIQLKNGLSFPDALKYTSEKLGMNIESLTPLTEDQKAGLVERERNRQEQAKKQRQDSILKVQQEAQSFIATCTPLNGTGHAYLKKKGIESCESVLCFKNDLVLPYTDIDGVVWNLQKILNKTINIDGHETNKLFMRGNLKPGLFFTIPGNEHFGYSEGFATGRSVSMATGKTILVCGTAHNVIEVIKANLKKNPESKHTFYADDEWWKSAKENTGRKTGQKAAKLGIAVRYPEFKDDSKQLKDFNDFHVEYGIDELRKFLQKTENAVPDELPEIWIFKNNIPEMADKAEDAVVKAKYNLYQQGDELKKLSVIKTVNPDKVDYPDNLVVIKNVEPAYIREAFCRCAVWQKPIKIPKTDPPEFTSESVSAPKDVVEFYLSRSEKKLPILSGIIHTPMILTDNSILQKPGYDLKTGFYYHKTLNIKIPEKPSLKDAKKAIEILKKPIALFPFDDRSSLSVMLAAILTALNRKAWNTAPMFAFNSPTPRTGKSRLCECISIIATGETPVVLNMSDERSGEEFEKRLSGPVMRGSPVINIDNIPEHKMLGGEFLCQCLTLKLVDPRVLATNNNPRCPTNLTFLATGNNLQVKGDMQGRTLISTIDAEIERPENRKFDFDVSEYCLKHRSELVTAGLTILRAWRISKDKIDIPVWGSFEHWSEWIRKALVWCEEEDPYTANEKARQDDPDIVLIKRLLVTWQEYYGSLEKLTVKRLLSEADIPDKENAKKTALDDVIWEICNPKSKTPLNKQIGYFLKQFKGRVFNGLRLLASEKSEKTKSSNSWYVEKIIKEDKDLIDLL